MSDFFENFDFVKASESIRKLGPARFDSDVFANAINALYFRIKSGRVSFVQLTECLGPPDRMSTEGAAPVAEYDWAQLVSGNLIRATTRFRLLDGMIDKVLPSSD